MQSHCPHAPFAAGTVCIVVAALLVHQSPIKPTADALGTSQQAPCCPLSHFAHGDVFCVFFALAAGARACFSTLLLLLPPARAFGACESGPFLVLPLQQSRYLHVSPLSEITSRASRCPVARCGCAARGPREQRRAERESAFHGEWRRSYARYSDPREVGFFANESCPGRIRRRKLHPPRSSSSLRGFSPWR